MGIRETRRALSRLRREISGARVALYSVHASHKDMCELHHDIRERHNNQDIEHGAPCSSMVLVCDLRLVRSILWGDSRVLRLDIWLRLRDLRDVRATTRGLPDSAYSTFRRARGQRPNRGVVCAGGVRMCYTQALRCDTDACMR